MTETKAAVLRVVGRLHSMLPADDMEVLQWLGFTRDPDRPRTVISGRDRVEVVDATSSSSLSPWCWR